MLPLLLLLTLLLGLLPVSPRALAEGASLHRLGLFGPEFTREDGVQVSKFQPTLFVYLDIEGPAMVRDGYAAGYSEMYSGMTQFGRAVWVANASTGVTRRVGLFGSGYLTGSTAYSELVAGGRNYVAGYSARFSGTTHLGFAAWVATASTGTTKRVGLFDSPYTQSGGDTPGYQYSGAYLMDGSYVAGNSKKYRGTTYLGEASWVAKASTGATMRLGFTDGAHTQSGGATPGYQYSYLSMMSGSYVAGWSRKYRGTTDLGQTAWVANASTGVTTRVGLTNSAYTQAGGPASGYQESWVSSLGGGYAVGSSRKFSGTTDLGWAAWVANVTTGATTRVGLFNAAYAQSGGATPGYQYSFPTHRAAGYTAGVSKKYSGTAPRGQAAWVAKLSTGVTTRVGLIDRAYTKAGTNSGYQYSELTLMTDGYLTGYSEIYSGVEDRGYATWVATASTGVTTRIGLGYPSSGSPGGGNARYVSNNVRAIAGSYVAGFSGMYSATGTWLGQAGWVADARTGVTTPVGLTDSVHTRHSSGERSSGVDWLAGNYAAGSSGRIGVSPVPFAGQPGLVYGLTAWVYDITTGTTGAVELSVRASDGYAYSEILSLSESGLAVGRYTLFDESGNDLGYRAFAWTPEDGAFDLASAVAGGISADGFTRLEKAQYMTSGLPGSETIFGIGGAGGNAETKATFAVIP